LWERRALRKEEGRYYSAVSAWKQARGDKILYVSVTAPFDLVGTRTVSGPDGGPVLMAEKCRIRSRRRLRECSSRRCSAKLSPRLRNEMERESKGALHDLKRQEKLRRVNMQVGFCWEVAKSCQLSRHDTSLMRIVISLRRSTVFSGVQRLFEPLRDASKRWTVDGQSFQELSEGGACPGSKSQAMKSLAQ
jgi:hypothetical protein